MSKPKSRHKLCLYNKNGSLNIHFDYGIHGEFNFNFLMTFFGAIERLQFSGHAAGQHSNSFCIACFAQNVII